MIVLLISLRVGLEKELVLEGRGKEGWGGTCAAAEFAASPQR